MFEWFSTDGFPARWHCGYRWSETPSVGWVSIIADCWTAIQYALVPVILCWALLTLVRAEHRTRAVWTTIICISCFFILCGGDHLIQIVQFWWPIYPFAAPWKVATALSTTVALVCSIWLGRQIVASREQDQTDLHLARQSAEILLSHVRDGCYMVDIQGRTIWANRCVTEILGYSQADMIGVNQHWLLHYQRKSANGGWEKYPVDDCPIYEAYRSGTTQTRTEYLWDKQGHPVECTYTSYPVRDRDGELVGAYVIFRPVSEADIASEMRSLSRQAIEEVRALVRQKSGQE